MRVTLAGTGDAFGTGGRLNACFHVGASAGSFLIDCGASSLAALKRCGIDAQSSETVFVSHLHGDHFGGLCFLLREAVFERRRRPLTVLGPPGIRSRVETATEALFPDTLSRVAFDLRFIELKARTSLRVSGLGCTPFEVPHPSGAPSFALRIECEGRVIGYTGDAAWDPVLLEVADGADLFLCEAYSLKEPVRSHLAAEEIVRQPFRAKRMVAVHLGPETRSAATLSVPRGDDGMVIDL